MVARLAALVVGIGLVARLALAWDQALTPEQLQERVAQQEASITELKTQLEEARGEIAVLAERVLTLEARLQAVEKAAGVQGTAAPLETPRADAPPADGRTIDLRRMLPFSRSVVTALIGGYIFGEVTITDVKPAANDPQKLLLTGVYPGGRPGYQQRVSCTMEVPTAVGLEARTDQVWRIQGRVRDASITAQRGVEVLQLYLVDVQGRRTDQVIPVAPR